MTKRYTVDFMDQHRATCAASQIMRENLSARCFVSKFGHMFRMLVVYESEGDEP